jgi:hypothetical protein
MTSEDHKAMVDKLRARQAISIIKQAVYERHVTGVECASDLLDWICNEALAHDIVRPEELKLWQREYASIVEVE